MYTDERDSDFNFGTGPGFGYDSESKTQLCKLEAKLRFKPEARATLC